MDAYSPYAFAKTGEIYLVYIRFQDTIRVNLVAGSYRLRWFNPQTRQFYPNVDTITAPASGFVRLPPSPNAGNDPSNEDVVALLERI